MPDNHLDARTRIIAKQEMRLRARLKKRAAETGAGDLKLRLYEIGRLELPPRAMANREHPHRLPPFVDFIDDPVDVGLVAVKHNYRVCHWKQRLYPSGSRTYNCFMP